MPQIYLFTGENSEALLDERRRWTRQFSQKHGEDNLVRLDGVKLAMRDLLDAISVQPFLAEKRLVIVDGVPAFSKEQMRSLEEHIHPDVILALFDAKPDKRLVGVKELTAIATVKDFPPATAALMSGWIKQAAASLQVRLEPAAQSLLLEYLGMDQAMIAREIEKLSITRKGGIITVEDIEREVLPTDEGIVWRMTDYIAARNRAGALMYAGAMLERGADPYALWNVLLSLLRNVTAAHAALKSGVTNQKEIAEATGIHPFALRSVLPYARSVDTDAIAHSVHEAAEADIRLKTGGYRSTAEAPQELEALIDRTILSMP